MKFKNPFSLGKALDVAKNVAIGGGANVAIDFAWEQIEAVQGYEKYKDLGKLVLGSVVGAMLKPGSLGRIATDGIATVGASNFIQGIIDGKNIFGDSSTVSTEGLPNGTIGRIRYGSKRFGKRGKIAGDFIAAD